MRFVVVGTTAMLLALTHVAAALGQQELADGRLDDLALLDRPAGLTVHEIPLSSALRFLESSASVSVVYSQHLLPAGHLVTCSCRIHSVREALAVLLARTDLEFDEIGDQVVLRFRSPAGASPPRVAPSVGGFSGNAEREAISPPAVDPQEQVISGTVLDERGDPVPRVQVNVVGTNLGTLTDESGRFRIAGVPAGSVTLRANGIGFRPTIRQARGGQTGLRIVLARAAISLDEIVVTGTPGGVQKRSLGNAVARVDARSLMETAPVVDVSQLLNARAPGVVVRTPEGNAGGGSRILIRGRGSMQFDGSPLLYIDGVRVNNDFPVSTGSGSQLSRFDDIDPADIESIEVIKGPAAATLYGTEASAGVIQIITKKGRSGTTKFGVNVRQGATWLGAQRDKVGIVWGLDPGNGEPFSLDPLQVAESRGSPIFRTGYLQGYGLNVSGGSGDVQYFVSANYDRDQGIIPSNVAERFTGRANLSFQPHSTVNVTANLGVTTGETQLEPQFFYFGSARYALPVLRDTPNQGFLIMPPDAMLGTQQQWQDVERYTGSVSVDHRPTGWLSQRLTMGLDLTNQESVLLTPFVPSEFQQFFSPSAQLGSKSIQGDETGYTTFDYSATVAVPLTGKLQSTSAVGLQYYRRTVDTKMLSGQQFPAPGVTSIQGITGPRQVSQDIVENSTLGLFFQQQFGWQNRLFLTAAIRADDNSAFGADFDVVTYPKVSLSWVINEEPFWNASFVNALKLRAAYGESGQQPQAFASLRTYEPVSGENDQPAGTPNFVGNPDLGPERGKEVELGFEAGLFNDRIGLDFTFYYQRTANAIISREVAPSSGFPLTQFINAGEVENKGIELLLNLRPIEVSKFAWDLTLNMSTNANEVLSVDVPGVSFLGVGFIPNRHQPGFPVASFFGKRILSADLDASGNAINLVCDDGSGGGTGCPDAPQVFLGRNVPDKEGAVSTTFTFFNRLRLSALVDFKVGGRYFSADRAIRCRDFRIHEIVVFPERFDPVDVAYCQDPEGTGPFAEGFIMSGDFAKLREISLNYTLPERLAAALGASRAFVTVAARNILTFANDHGPFAPPDPETFNGGSFGNSLLDQAAIPIPVSFMTTVNIEF